MSDDTVPPACRTCQWDLWSEQYRDCIPADCPYPRPAAPAYREPLWQRAAWWLVLLLVGAWLWGWEAWENQRADVVCWAVVLVCVGYYAAQLWRVVG